MTANKKSERMSTTVSIAKINNLFSSVREIYLNGNKQSYMTLNLQFIAYQMMALTEKSPEDFGTLSSSIRKIISQDAKTFYHEFQDKEFYLIENFIGFVYCLLTLLSKSMLFSAQTYSILSALLHIDSANLFIFRERSLRMFLHDDKLEKLEFYFLANTYEPDDETTKAFRPLFASTPSKIQPSFVALDQTINIKEDVANKFLGPLAKNIEKVVLKPSPFEGNFSNYYNDLLNHLPREGYSMNKDLTRLDQLPTRYYIEKTSPIRPAEKEEQLFTQKPITVQNDASPPNSFASPPPNSFASPPPNSFASPPPNSFTSPPPNSFDSASPNSFASPLPSSSANSPFYSLDSPVPNFNDFPSPSNLFNTRSSQKSVGSSKKSKASVKSSCLNQSRKSNIPDFILNRISEKPDKLSRLSKVDISFHEEEKVKEKEEDEKDGEYIIEYTPKKKFIEEDTDRRYMLPMDVRNEKKVKAVKPETSQEFPFSNSKDMNIASAFKMTQQQNKTCQSTKRKSQLPPLPFNPMTFLPVFNTLEMDEGKKKCTKK